MLKRANNKTNLDNLLIFNLLEGITADILELSLISFFLNSDVFTRQFLWNNTRFLLFWLKKKYRGIILTILEP